MAELAASGSVWDFELDLAVGESETAGLFEFAVDVLGGRLDVLLHVAGISGRRLGDAALHECSSRGVGQRDAGSTLSVPFSRTAMRCSACSSSRSTIADCGGPWSTSGQSLTVHRHRRTSERWRMPRARGRFGP